MAPGGPGRGITGARGGMAPGMGLPLGELELE